MTFSTLWQRYILKEVLKVFLLFLFCFFFLYILVDYSMHMQEILKNKKIDWGNLLLYYGMLFSKRSDLLLPLSLLIACVKVFTSLNQKNELLALQTAGIPLHHLTRPLFFVALLCVGLNYANLEALAPRSLSFIDHFEKKHLKKVGKKKIKPSAVYTLTLEDGRRVIYQSLNENTIEDLFYILSDNEILHMKTLELSTPYPVGSYVDCLKRNDKGQLEKVASFDKLPLPDLKIQPELHDPIETHLENLSISKLLQVTFHKPSLFREDRRAIHTHLYYKILMPWLSVIALIGAIPYCVVSSRHLPTFMIFSLAIFGYIAFYALLDGCVILGELHVAPPFWAIFTLPMIFLFIFGPRFYKICISSTL